MQEQINHCTTSLTNNHQKTVFLALLDPYILRTANTYAHNENVIIYYYLRLLGILQLIIIQIAKLLFFITQTA